MLFVTYCHYCLHNIASFQISDADIETAKKGSKLSKPRSRIFDDTLVYINQQLDRPESASNLLHLNEVIFEAYPQAALQWYIMVRRNIASGQQCITFLLSVYTVALTMYRELSIGLERRFSKIAHTYKFGWFWFPLLKFTHGYVVVSTAFFCTIFVLAFPAEIISDDNSVIIVYRLSIAILSIITLIVFTILHRRMVAYIVLVLIHLVVGCSVVLIFCFIMPSWMRVIADYPGPNRSDWNWSFNCSSFVWSTSKAGLFHNTSALTSYVSVWWESNVACTSDGVILFFGGSLFQHILAPLLGTAFPFLTNLLFLFLERSGSKANKCVTSARARASIE